MATFLLEPLLLCLLSGFVGVACNSPLQWIAISTVNWGTFSEPALTFRLTQSIPAYALVVAALMVAPVRGHGVAFVPKT